VAAQVAFCFLVHFVAGLFVGSFDRLVSQPTGFDAQGLLIANVRAQDKVPLAGWQEVEDRLRELPGVAAAGTSRWPLMSDYIGRSQVWVAGKRPKDESPLFLEVSPGWFETMRIPFRDGAAFRRAQANAVVVNQRFAAEYLPGRVATGAAFERRIQNRMTPFEITGVTGDVRSRGMRDPFEPTMFVPFGESDWGSFLVRVDGPNPLALASTLREEIPRVRPEFRVSNITTQEALVQSHTIRERLLAMLSAFFAGVALVLAAVGLFGVLSYAVVQRTREIGIRMALGAKPGHVARKVTAEVFGMLILGSVAGLAAGLAAERYIESLLFEVKATDAPMLALPVVTIFAAALVAALPPVLRAIRIDPATALRSE
jgi:predicted permease